MSKEAKGSVPTMENKPAPPKRPEKEKFPTKPDKDGYFFASDDEKEQGIKTKDFENGSTTKTLKLSNGKEAVVRKLKGRDFIETKKRVQNDESLDFETVNMSVAIKLDGKTEPPEYYLDDLYQSDFAKLMIAFGALNF